MQDDNFVDEENDNNQSTEAEQMAKGAANEAKNAAKKATKETAKLAAKHLSKYVTIAALSNPITLTIIGILLIFIIILPIFLYMLSGPSNMYGQITGMADELWTQAKSALVGAIQGQDYGDVTDKHVAQVAGYVENMGFSLVGYAFVNNENEIVRNSNKEIEKLKNAEVLTAYLAAENRTYMLSTVSVASLYRYVKRASVWSY